MATELDKLHCQVLANRQESALRETYFAQQPMPEYAGWFTAEHRVGLELDRILRLCETAIDREHGFPGPTVPRRWPLSYPHERHE